jgi:hypothetical protein
MFGFRSPKRARICLRLVLYGDIIGLPCIVRHAE